jgi:hypothetical protein
MVLDSIIRDVHCSLSIVVVDVTGGSELETL